MLHVRDDGGILEHHAEDTPRHENYDGEIVGGNGDEILDVCGDDVDGGVPYGKAFCDIHGGKSFEIRNGNAGGFRNGQDDVGLQLAMVGDGRGILNGKGYEILGVFGFGENGDVHYSGVNLSGCLAYYGDTGGQTLCGVDVWLQNGNDNGEIEDAHCGDTIQKVYY